MDASDIAGVVALHRADDPEADDDPELMQLLERNAALADPVATVGAYPRISEYRPDRGNRGGDIGAVRQAKDILWLSTKERVRINSSYVHNDFTASDPNRSPAGLHQAFLRPGGGSHRWARWLGRAGRSIRSTREVRRPTWNDNLSALLPWW